MGFAGRFFKAAQRRSLSLLQTPGGLAAFAALLLAATLVSVFGALQLTAQLTQAAASRSACRATSDNLAETSFAARLCGESVDLVYTWVNGSDPAWLAQMALYRGAGAEGNGSAPSNSTASSANRYRDNGELKYSLRSVEKYAPWLRSVILVTNGQVPSWLNLAHPRLRVVTHADIFPNASHLPVFSSPAIEVHLHRIPGLSSRFIYFNDDVLLGADVWPDDFATHAKGQKVYLSWEVPKCASGCQETWLADSYCDAACNTTRCQFDGGDCLGNNTRARAASTSSYHSRGGYNSASTRTGTSSSDTLCTVGCPDTWVGDRMCDSKCANIACGWDGGDCGMPAIINDLPGAQPVEEGAGASLAEGLEGAPSAAAADRAAAEDDVAPALAAALQRRMQPIAAGALLRGNASDGELAFAPLCSAALAPAGLQQPNASVPHSILREALNTLTAALSDVRAAPVAVTLTAPEGGMARHEPNSSCGEGCDPNLPSPALYLNMSGVFDSAVQRSAASVRRLHALLQDEETLAAVHAAVCLSASVGEACDGWFSPPEAPHNASAGAASVAPQVHMTEPSRPRAMTAPCASALVDAIRGSARWGATSKPPAVEPEPAASSANATSAGPSAEPISADLEPPAALASIVRMGVLSAYNGVVVILLRQGVAEDAREQRTVTRAAPVCTAVALNASDEGVSDGGVSIGAWNSSLPPLPAMLQHPVCRWEMRNETTSLASSADSPLALDNVTTCCCTLEGSVRGGLTAAGNAGLNGTREHCAQMLSAPSSAANGVLLPGELGTLEVAVRLRMSIPQPTQAAEAGNRSSVSALMMERIVRLNVTLLAHARIALHEAVLPVPVPLSLTDLLALSVEKKEATQAAAVLSEKTAARVAAAANETSAAHNRTEVGADAVTPSADAAGAANAPADRGSATPMATAVLGGPVRRQLAHADNAGDKASAVPPARLSMRIIGSAVITSKPAEKPGTPASQTEGGASPLEEEAPLLEDHDLLIDEPITTAHAHAASRVGAALRARALAAASPLGGDDAEGSALRQLIATAWRRAVTAAAAGASGASPHVMGRAPLSSAELWEVYERLQAERDSLATPGVGALRAGGRRLSGGNSEDTYGDSLVFTNRLFTSAFGRRARKVPAHMPHMIDVSVMTALQARWPAEFEATSAHRFRSSNDIQYSFAYFTAVMEGIGRAGVDMNVYWSRELDTDGDGILSDNEFRTLAAVVYHRAPTPGDLAALRNCTAPTSEVWGEAAEAVREVAGAPALVREATRTLATPLVTLARVLDCSIAVAGLTKYARSAATHEEANHDEVAFEMVTDDFNRTRAQLDSIRARKVKFVCVNDDQREAPPATRELLADFYDSLLPAASAFELPEGRHHAEPLALDAIRSRERSEEARRGGRAQWVAVAVLAGALAMALRRRGGGGATGGEVEEGRPRGRRR